MYILLKSFFPNFIKLREESVQESPSEESSKLSEEEFIDIGILLKNEDDDIVKQNVLKNEDDDIVKQNVLKKEDDGIVSQNILKNEDDAIVSQNVLKKEDAQVGSVQTDDMNILLKNEDNTCNKAQVNILLARYSRMQLIDICRQYGLPRAGGKVQLAERIAIYKIKD